MKKQLLLILLLNCFHFSFAQEAFKFSFENVPLESALKEIEDVTSFKFYYQNEWVFNEQVTVDFDGSSINDVLDSLLNETSLNYSLIENKVILTKGNYVLKALPNNFFNNNENQPISESTTPIFHNKSLSTETEKVEKIIIGKDNVTTKSEFFILEGIIKNQITGEPLSQGNLLVEGTSKYAITNEEGYYSLSLKRGLNTITIQALGMESLKVEVLIYNNGNLNFTLKEGVEQLDEILLKSNARNNVTETLAGVTKIEVEEIKNIPLILGERDILKVATTLPGITTAGEGAAGYNIRGGKTDQNLILLDGASIYNPAHFFGLFSAINPFTTGDVQIYKGSIPANFGGRLSSVIEITTKDASTEKFQGEVSIGPVTGNVTLEVPVVKEKAGLIVGGRGTYSNWILSTLENPDLKDSKANFFDIIAKYNHKLNEKSTLKVTGYYSNDLFNITKDSIYSYNNILASLNWVKQINESTKTNLKLAHSTYQFGIEFDSRFNNDFDFDFDLQETELSYSFDKKINEKHSLNVGVASKLYRINPGNIKPINEESTVTPFSVNQETGLESAIYIQDQWNVSKKFSISAGFRFSMFSLLGKTTQRTYLPNLPLNEATVIETTTFGKNEFVKTFTNPEVRISTRYLITPDFSTRAAYNSSYQYIHSLSNNTTASPIDTWKLSDTHIIPQKSDHFSLGFFKNFDANNYELSLEGYYKKLDNILDYKVGGQLLLNEFVETEVLQGDGKSFGVEFLLKKNKGKWNGWLAYTYSKTQYRLNSEFPEERVNGGRFFPANFDKPHDLNLVLNYKLTKRFSFSGNFAYQTGRPITYPVGVFQEGGSNFVLYSDRNQFRIPDYYRLDIGFNMEGNHKIKKFAHSFWNISIYNVLGRNNPFSVFFVTDNGEIKAYKSTIFSVPVPTLTYNFKF